jgi:hypothetical protein
MSTNAFGAATETTSRYVCLNGCGYTTTSRREFDQHRRRAGHDHHGTSISQWP